MWDPGTIPNSEGLPNVPHFQFFLKKPKKIKKNQFFYLIKHFTYNFCYLKHIFSDFLGTDRKQGDNFFTRVPAGDIAT